MLQISFSLNGACCRYWLDYVLLRTYSRPLGMLLLHVPTHAAHHRSEFATMLTMASGSPPDTGINSYYREKPERGTPSER